MRHNNRLAFALFLLVGGTTASYAQQDMEKLIEKADPAVQAQIQKLLNTLQTSNDDPRGNLDVCREVQALKKLSADNDELVKQLAIFVATTKSIGETHGLILPEILKVLEFPPEVPIRVLAPYLDADNPQLRDSVRLWFNLHDAAHTMPPGAPPIKPVNYSDYVGYVESKVTHTEDVPPPFTKYIFERSPGRALLVFAYANSHGDVTARLFAMRKKLEAVQPTTKEEQEQNEKGRKQATKESREARLKERREVELLEHVVSNAIWLKSNKFDERFQAALPEATAELAKLAKHEEWWARLYVVYIMRQNPALLQDHIMRQLAEDENELVREAVKLGEN